MLGYEVPSYLQRLVQVQYKKHVMLKHQYSNEETPWWEWTLEVLSNSIECFHIKFLLVNFYFSVFNWSCWLKLELVVSWISINQQRKIRSRTCRVTHLKLSVYLSFSFPNWAIEACVLCYAWCCPWGKLSLTNHPPKCLAKKSRRSSICQSL